MAGSPYVMNAGPFLGTSATFTRYVGTLTRSAVLRGCRIVTDTTVTEDGTNYWTYDLQINGSSVLESGGTWSTLSTADGTLTGGTAEALTVETEPSVYPAGSEVTFVATKTASGADQSAVYYTVTAEFSE